MILNATTLHILRDQLRVWGVMTAPALALGVRVSDLEAEISRDPELKAEVDECLSNHADSLYMMAMTRAQQGRDTMLVKLLEARVPQQFDAKRRNAEIEKKGRPPGLRVRSFEDADDVTDVTDVEEKKPSPPAEPLQIGFEPF